MALPPFPLPSARSSRQAGQRSSCPTPASVTSSETVPACASPSLSHATRACLHDPQCAASLLPLATPRCYSARLHRKPLLSTSVDVQMHAVSCLLQNDRPAASSQLSVRRLRQSLISLPHCTWENLGGDGGAQRLHARFATGVAKPTTAGVQAR
jgi:hypothetical protein